ncbi:MAG: hypothetical protein KF832_12960, partial [Caldilineaceae bacterium]|nr:hypothetical protein [Caldilineaceae bacterium]
MSTLLGNLRVGVDYATFEAKKQARLLNGQNKVRRLRAQEQEQLLDLGQAAWNLYMAGQPLDRELQEICQQIQNTLQQITQQEAQVEAIRQEQPPEPIKCSSCSRELKPEDAFCSVCGHAAPQAKPVSVAEEPSQSCPHCGREIR